MITSHHHDHITQYRNYITAEPDMVQIPLNGNEVCLVVACDGLWDVIPKDKVSGKEVCLAGQVVY